MRFSCPGGPSAGGAKGRDGWSRYNPIIMDKASREKIALVVFALLVVFAGVVLTGYFSTARTWNVAASFVDDTVGRMDGYTVLVYSGTVSPDEAAADEPPSSKPPIDPATNSIGLAILPILGAFNASEDEAGAVFVSDVRAMYEQKDAAVLSLDASDLARYAEPQVLRAGGRRIGVYSLDAYASGTLLALYEKRLREEGAELVVCLTRRTALVGSFDHADVVVVTGPEKGLTTGGEDRGRAFVVESPERGSVGVVVVTSSNVRSARVIEG